MRSEKDHSIRIIRNVNVRHVQSNPITGVSSRLARGLASHRPGLSPPVRSVAIDALYPTRTQSHKAASRSPVVTTASCHPLLSIKCRLPVLRCERRIVGRRLLASQFNRLSDMHGNLWEWCRDRYAVKIVGGTNTGGPLTGSERLDLGGGFFNLAGYSRSACRGKNAPSARQTILGFRVCLNSG